MSRRRRPEPAFRIGRTFPEALAAHARLQDEQDAAQERAADPLAYAGVPPRRTLLRRLLGR